MGGMEYIILLIPVVLAVYFFLKAQKLKEENIQLKAEKGAQQVATEEKLALVSNAQERLSQAFKALSAEALEKSNTSFLQLAKETLGKFQEKAKGDLDKRQQSIEEVLKPVRESLGKLDSGMRAIEKERKGDQESLKQQLKMMVDAEKELRTETSTLVKASAPLSYGGGGEKCSYDA